MNITELCCCKCGHPNRIPLWTPLDEESLSNGLVDATPRENKNIKLESLLIINSTLWEQVNTLKQSLKINIDFIECLFSKYGDIPTPYQMLEIVSQIQSLKEKKEHE